VLAGATGSDGVFNVTSTPDLGFHDVANSLQTAQDSVIEFEGLSITRSSNEISDVIDGTTINLVATTSSDVRLNITNDKSTLKTNLQAMVDTYNGLNTLFDTVTSTSSEDELGGSLSDDISMVRFLTDQIRTAIFADSSTKSGNITAMRDLGISVDKSGAMTFTETTYDAAVLANYDDIVTMLTADTSNESLFTTTNKGLAQDIATTLGNFTDSDGIVTTRSEGATEDLADHKEELVELEKRMEAVYERYLAQFTAMESLMASMDATKEYLTGQLESLSKAYDHN
jgi:flagellar hook-associated protein 2